MAQIDLEMDKIDGIYIAGDYMNGKVIILTNEKMNINQMLVELRGEAQNSWINKQSEKIYESDEIHMNDSIEIIKNVYKIRPGRQEFPIKYKLSSGLPSSFEGEYGHIRYQAKASVTVTERDEQIVVQKSFIVFARSNLNNFPSAQRPVEARDTTDYSCCCIPWGSVQTQLDISKNGYLPSENITIAGQIRNASRKGVENAQLLLVQQARFKARSRYENAEDKKHMEYIISAANIGTVQPGKHIDIEEIKIIVPKIVPTCEGNTISINYVLKFQAEPEIELEVPVIIGSVCENE